MTHDDTKRESIEQLTLGICTEIIRASAIAFEKSVGVDAGVIVLLWPDEPACGSQEERADVHGFVSNIKDRQMTIKVLESCLRKLRRTS